VFSSYNEERSYSGDRVSTYKDYRLSSDTTPEAEQFLFGQLAKKSAAEKLQMVCQMNASVQVLAMTGLRERYPHETDRQLKFRLAELVYGREIVDRVAQRLRQDNE
jgi:hypothetical protein